MSICLLHQDPDSIDCDGLWETYHHIAKLAELGSDERGNAWHQQTFGCPVNEDSFAFAAGFEPPVEADDLCGTGMCFYGWYANLQGVRMNRHGRVQEDDELEPVEDYVNRRSGLRCHNLGLAHPMNTLFTIRKILIQLTGVDRGETEGER